jgi:hypothetical protein
MPERFNNQYGSGGDKDRYRPYESGFLVQGQLDVHAEDPNNQACRQKNRGHRRKDVEIMIGLFGSLQSDFLF